MRIVTFETLWDFPHPLCCFRPGAGEERRWRSPQGPLQERSGGQETETDAGPLQDSAGHHGGGGHRCHVGVGRNLHLRSYRLFGFYKKIDVWLNVEQNWKVNFSHEKLHDSMKIFLLEPPAISQNTSNPRELCLPQLDRAVCFITQKSRVVLFPSVASLSLLLFFFFSPFFGHRSVPAQIPPTVSVHTAVARVPSPTLVYSAVAPYRYRWRRYDAAVRLIWLNEWMPLFHRSALFFSGHVHTCTATFLDKYFLNSQRPQKKVWQNIGKRAAMPPRLTDAQFLMVRWLYSS